jgi:hypothetical protein
MTVIHSDAEKVSDLWGRVLYLEKSLREVRTVAREYGAEV